ncbi:hypothetical protein GUJ16_13915 [Enterococcus hirae]|nr:hypothetical protein [Enterococcus hirae]
MPIYAINNHERPADPGDPERATVSGTCTWQYEAGLSKYSSDQEITINIISSNLVNFHLLPHSFGMTYGSPKEIHLFLGDPDEDVRYVFHKVAHRS